MHGTCSRCWHAWRDPNAVALFKVQQQRLQRLQSLAATPCTSLAHRRRLLRRRAGDFPRSRLVIDVNWHRLQGFFCLFFFSFLPFLHCASASAVAAAGASALALAGRDDERGRESGPSRQPPVLKKRDGRAFRSHKGAEEGRFPCGSLNFGFLF